MTIKFCNEAVNEDDRTQIYRLRTILFMTGIYIFPSINRLINQHSKFRIAIY